MLTTILSIALLMISTGIYLVVKAKEQIYQ